MSVLCLIAELHNIALLINILLGIVGLGTSSGSGSGSGEFKNRVGSRID